jgi:isopenicillin N synthase-like dioxygenase
MVFLCFYWHSDIALEYSKKIREITILILKGISKSLGLEESYIDKATNFELGLQILAANLYPACPEPERAIGLPPHSDHGLVTLLMDNGISGLQVQHKGEWVNVNLNLIPNAFLAHIGDHMEVRSVMHHELHFNLSLCIIHLVILLFHSGFVFMLFSYKRLCKASLIQF